MNHSLQNGAIHVLDFNLWAHVGVLEEERLLGQEFLLDFSLWLDMDKAAVNDDLTFSADYSVAVTSIQKLAFQINCHTLEKFTENILDCLEELYGPIPMKVFLRKCNPPLPGFNGVVGIERNRYLKKD